MTMFLSENYGLRRIVGSTLIAASVTGGLFLAMKSMAASDDVYMNEVKSRPQINVIQDIKENPPKPKPPKDDKPPVVIETPVPDKPTTKFDNDTIDVTHLPPVEPPADNGDDRYEFTPTDSPMMVLAAYQPTYPTKAINGNIEGFCITSVTVRADGSVDPASVVVTDENPIGVFTKSCISAIKKFKFQPAVKNGKAHSVENVTYRFQFKLADD